MAKECLPQIVVSSPDGTRHEHPLVGDRITVGRAVPGYTPDIALGPDPQAWVSRLHCWFERVHGSWHVVDNRSVNGTLIERRGSRDTVNGRLRLRDKDEVLILGYLIDDEPSGGGSASTTRSTSGPTLTETTGTPCVEYSLTEARLTVVRDGRRRTEISLGRNRRKLVRHMASRNAANGEHRSSVRTRSSSPRSGVNPRPGGTRLRAPRGTCVTWSTSYARS